MRFHAGQWANKDSVVTPALERSVSWSWSTVLGPRSVAESSRGFATVREGSGNSGSRDFDGLSIF